MANIDFPADPGSLTPANYWTAPNGIRYFWNGARWRSSSADSYIAMSGTGTNSVSGNISLADSVKLEFGAADDLAIYHDGTNNYIDFDTGELRLSVAGTAKMTLDSSGNGVFTGTVTGATPTATGHLTTKAYVDSAITAEDFWDRDSGTSTLSPNTASDNVSIAGDLTVNTDALFVDASAKKVGIGTTSPGANLEIKPGTGNGTLLIDRATGSTSDGALNIEVASSGALYETRKTGGLDHIWYAAGIQQMSLKSSGDLALGTTITGGHTNHTNIFFGGTGNLYGDTAAAASSSISLSSNAYVNSSGNWVYRVTDEVTNYYQSDGAHVWRYAASGTAGNTISWSEAMRIDSSGVVKIGDSSTASPNITLTGSTGDAAFGTNAVKLFGSSTSGALGGSVSIQQVDPGGNAATFKLLKGINYSGTEVCNITATGAATFAGTILTGWTSVNISTSNGSSLNGSGTSWHSATNDYPLGVNRLGSDGYLQVFTKAGTTCGYISVASGTTSYVTSSDYRLKENITAITSGIDRLKQLKPSRFNFKTYTGRTVDGFVAHEVSSVVPEAITGEKDAMRDEEYEVTPAVEASEGVDAVPAVMGTRSVPDYQGIDQSKLVPLLTAALQEAIAKIENLEAKVEALENS